MRSAPRLAAAVALALALWLPPSAAAAPVRPAEITLTQPDGTTFTARPFGDEHYHGYETAGGRTIVRRPGTGTWEYAVPGARGRLVPGGRRVGRDAAGGIARHLRDRVALGRARRPLARKLRPLDQPNGGTQPVLVILAEFADEEASSAVAPWAARVFGATGSLRDYYDEVSFGELDLVPAAESNGTADDGVVGWLTLDSVHPGGNAGAEDRLAHDAVLAADDDVDFARFDADGNGFLSTRELHVIVVAAGQEGSHGNDCPGQALWGHQGTLATSDQPEVDGVRIGSESEGGGHMELGELHCDHIATLGILAHEFGHDLGLPDLYDTDLSSEGAGEWSIMASGSWVELPGAEAGSLPPHPDPFSKWYEGWLEPERIEGQAPGHALPAAAAAPAAVQLLDNPGGVDWTLGGERGTGEYFLVEHRRPVGYDAGLPGCGLLVWHIDETRRADNDANADDARRLVDVEEADGRRELDTGASRGDAGDLYPGTTGNVAFDGSSDPGSSLYSGAGSGVAVRDPSACAPAMTADFEAPGPGGGAGHDAFAAALELTGSDVRRTADANAGATKEAGEPAHAGNGGGASVWYAWTAPASGAVALDTAGSGFDTLLAVYTGARVDALSEVASNDDDETGATLRTSRLAFAASAGTTYRIAVDGYRGATGTIALHLSLFNDAFAAAHPLPDAGATRTGTNAGATKEPGEPSHAGNAGGASVWYRWTAPGGRVTVQTTGSGFDTLLAVYTGAAPGALALVAENDDVGGSDRTSRVTFTAAALATYHIAVDGYDGEEGAIRLSLGPG